MVRLIKDLIIEIQLVLWHRRLAKGVRDVRCNPMAE